MAHRHNASALANAAFLIGKRRGHLVFGIDDGSHPVVSTRFEPQADYANGEQLLPRWLSHGVDSTVEYAILAVETATNGRK